MTVATRRVVVNSNVVAFVLPLRTAAWTVRAQGAHRSAARLRALTAGVPIAACVLTGVAWVFMLHSGIFRISHIPSQPALLKLRSVGTLLHRMEEER